jgi:hypothetical protein
MEEQRKRRRELDAALASNSCEAADTWVMFNELNSYVLAGKQPRGKGFEAYDWLAQWVHLYTKVESERSGFRMCDIKTQKEYQTHFSKENMESDIEWLTRSKDKGGCGLGEGDCQVLIAKFFVRFRDLFAAGVKCSYGQMGVAIGKPNSALGVAQSKRALAVHFLKSRRIYHLPLKAVKTDKQTWHRDETCVDSQLIEAAGVLPSADVLEWLDFSKNATNPARSTHERWNDEPLLSAAGLAYPDEPAQKKRRVEELSSSASGHAKKHWFVRISSGSWESTPTAEDREECHGHLRDRGLHLYKRFGFVGGSGAKKHWNLFQKMAIGDFVYPCVSAETQGPAPLEKGGFVGVGKVLGPCMRISQFIAEHADPNDKAALMELPHKYLPGDNSASYQGDKDDPDAEQRVVRVQWLNQTKAAKWEEPYDGFFAKDVHDSLHPSEAWYVPRVTISEMKEAHKHTIDAVLSYFDINGSAPVGTLPPALGCDRDAPAVRPAVGTVSAKQPTGTNTSPVVIKVGTRFSNVSFPGYGKWSGEVATIEGSNCTVRYWDEHNGSSEDAWKETVTCAKVVGWVRGSHPAAQASDQTAAPSAAGIKVEQNEGESESEGTAEPTEKNEESGSAETQHTEVDGADGTDGIDALNVDQEPREGDLPTLRTPLTAQTFRQRSTCTAQASDLIAKFGREKRWKDGMGAKLLVQKTLPAGHLAALKRRCEDSDDWGQVDQGQVTVGLINDMSDPVKMYEWIDTHGLFATDDIPAGELNLRYVGEFKTDAEYNAQVDSDMGNEDKYLYTVDFSGGLCSLTIDATSVQGAARFINDYRTDVKKYDKPENQSRSANVEFLEVVYKGKVNIAVYNRRMLSKGEQLLVDYGDSFWKEYPNVLRRMEGAQNSQKVAIEAYRRQLEAGGQLVKIKTETKQHASEPE